jgi:hypothetical protein
VYCAVLLQRAEFVVADLVGGCERVCAVVQLLGYLKLSCWFGAVHQLIKRCCGTVVPTPAMQTTGWHWGQLRMCGTLSGHCCWCADSCVGWLKRKAGHACCAIACQRSRLACQRSFSCQRRFHNYYNNYVSIVSREDPLLTLLFFFFCVLLPAAGAPFVQCWQF